MLDKLSQLRELQGMDEEELIERGLQQAEQSILRGLGKVREDVDEKRRTEWMDRETIRSRLQSMDADAHEQQVAMALDALEQDVARVFITYHEMVLFEDGIRNFLDAIGTLIVSLHSPVVQESLLVAVRDPYREQVREQMELFGALLWGWAETTAGEDGGHAKTYLELAATRWDADKDDLYATLFESD